MAFFEIKTKHVHHIMKFRLIFVDIFQVKPPLNEISLDRKIQIFEFV